MELCTGEFEFRPVDAGEELGVVEGGWEYAGLPAQVKGSEVDGHLLRLNVSAMDKDAREVEGSMEITARRPDEE